MNKATTKRMFNAIQEKDLATLYAILRDNPDAMETVGEHNRNVRDKTPLMFAMQCWNISLANALLDRGAKALLASRRAALQLMTIEIDQRELGGNKETGTDRQDEADTEHDPFIHSGAPLPWWPANRSEGGGAWAYVKEGHP